MTHSHFTYGLVNPLMGFGFALAGSFLGLTCMVYARKLPSGRARVKWLTFGSLAIGGTGIWMMHFIAMIGFTVDGGNVKYDLAITAASLLISIASVAVGLFIVGQGRKSFLKVALGGVLTGLGVVSMHYTGMAAMNIAGEINYNLVFVIASVVIAIVAATVALFFTTWVSGRGSLIMASVIMATAVCGMHYTGMYAISVESDPTPQRVPGVDPLLLLIPILILATGVLIALIVGVLGERDETEPDAIEVNPKAIPQPETTEPVPSLWNPAQPADDSDPRLSDGQRSSVNAALAERTEGSSRFFTKNQPSQEGSQDSTSQWAATLRDDTSLEELPK